MWFRSWFVLNLEFIVFMLKEIIDGLYVELMLECVYENCIDEKELF